MLRKLIKKGELTVIDHDGKEYRYGAPDPAFSPIKARLTDRRAAFAIASDPRMGAGEAYMDGRLVIDEGDIRDLVLLVRYNDPWEQGGDLRSQSRSRARLRRSAAHRPDQLEDTFAAQCRAHLQSHARLYELFLDEDRQYTCAYYLDPDNSLEQAQLDKKAHLAAKLNLKPGMRVLDIGCGWGGLALYLHRHYDVDVVGIALAPDQIDFSNERAAEAGVADRVKFKLMDYRDVDGPFDRIVNVGLIEHLGTPHYPGFYQRCRELLAPGGLPLIDRG